jgi:hypothetical protein
MTKTDWLATLLGSVGTARALPAMRAVRTAGDDETALLATHLDRFARWAALRACCHIVAFIAIATAVSPLYDRQVDTVRS